MRIVVNTRFYFILLIIYFFSSKVYCQVDYRNLSIKDRLKYNLIKTLLTIKEKDIVFVDKKVVIKNNELISVNYSTYPFRVIHQEGFRPWDIEFNLEKEKVKFIWNKNATKIIGVSSFLFDCSILYNKNGTISKVVEGLQKTYENGPYSYFRQSYIISYDKNLNLSGVTEQITKYQTDSLDLFVDSINYKGFDRFYEYYSWNDLMRFEYKIYSGNLDNQTITWHEIDSVEYFTDTMKLHSCEITEKKNYLYTFIYEKANLTEIRFNDLKHCYNDWNENIQIDSLGFVSKYSRTTLNNNERIDLIINYTFNSDRNQYNLNCLWRVFNSKGNCYLERNNHRMERKLVNGEWTEWISY
jgi:hypothetical protein